jgi:gluconolactonase
MWQFEILDAPYGGVSEGPAWDGHGLLFTHIQKSRILRYDPKLGVCTTYRENTNYANGLTFDYDGRLYGCEGGATADSRRVVRYNSDGSLTVLADGYEGKSLNIPNDLVVDRGGSVWFTDPFYEGAAGPWSHDRGKRELTHDSVYRIDLGEYGEHTMERVTFDTTRPNGLVFSLDFGVLYVAQSGHDIGEPRQLRAYPVKSDKRLSTPEVLHDFGKHRGIDGMRLDAQGNIVATAGWELGGPGPMIYVFSPVGEILEMHPVPCRRPTNCEFGDEDLRTLYVTTIDGALLRARTDRVGRCALQTTSSSAGRAER